jgi:tetratricopeptide (TPR) repeat protein
MIRCRTLLPALLSLCLLMAAAGCLGPRGHRASGQLNQLLQSGNEALLAGRYDEAIRQFDAGLSLSPGNPTFLANKAVALRSRGVGRYNASLQPGDEAAKAAGKEAARQDFRDAAAFAGEATKQIKAVPAWETLWDRGAYENNRLAAFAARAEALRLLASKFDKSRADEALEAIHEYAEVERDGEKRLKARLGAGQMLLDVGKGEQAAAEYKKVLADDPNNLDAMLGVGLALFQTGDKAKYRDAASYLRRFVDRAPEDHPLRGSAKDALDFMNQQGGGAGGGDTR